MSGTLESAAFFRLAARRTGQATQISEASLEPGQSTDRLRIRERGGSAAIEARFLGAGYSVDIEDASRDPELLIDETKHSAAIVMPASPMRLEAPEPRASEVFWLHFRKARETGSSVEE